MIPHTYLSESTPAGSDPKGEGPYDQDPQNQEGRDQELRSQDSQSLEVGAALPEKIYYCTHCGAAYIDNSANCDYCSTGYLSQRAPSRADLGPMTELVRIPAIMGRRGLTRFTLRLEEDGIPVEVFDDSTNLTGEVMTPFRIRVPKNCLERAKLLLDAIDTGQ